MPAGRGCDKLSSDNRPTGAGEPGATLLPPGRQRLLVIENEVFYNVIGLRTPHLVRKFRPLLLPDTFLRRYFNLHRAAELRET